jgi:hypothetical protein
MSSPVQRSDQAADQIGLYHYDVENDVWAWSSEIYVMHGYKPGDVVPTTELLVKHRHADDRRYVTEAIEEARRTGEPFSCPQRVVAADGRIWSVVVIGEADRAADGQVNAIRGYFVDVTLSRAQEADQLQQAEDEAAGLQRAMASRAIIEQAKGMLMLAYGCGASAAFDLLIDASQRANTKLRYVAEGLVEAMQTGTAQSDEARELLEEALVRLSKPAGSQR